MDYYGIIDSSGAVIAVAADLKIVERFISDCKNYAKYLDRKKELECQRRANKNKLKPPAPGIEKNNYARELEDIRQMINKYPNMKNTLIPERDRVQMLLNTCKVVAKQRQEEYDKILEDIDRKWRESLSEQDLFIYTGKWERMKNGCIPSYKKIPFLSK